MIFEIFASARRCSGRAFGLKVSGAQVFYFCNGNVKTLPIENTFKLYTVPPKTLSLQRYSPIFKIFDSARRCWGWEFGCKVSSAQVFYFSNGKVKNLPMNNIWKFATFNLYTVPAKILYLPRYSTDFEIFASARRCWGWAFGWNV